MTSDLNANADRLAILCLHSGTTSVVESIVFMWHSLVISKMTFQTLLARLLCFGPNLPSCEPPFKIMSRLASKLVSLCFFVLGHKHQTGETRKQVLPSARLATGVALCIPLPPRIVEIRNLQSAVTIGRCVFAGSSCDSNRNIALANVIANRPSNM